MYFLSAAFETSCPTHKEPFKILRHVSLIRGFVRCYQITLYGGLDQKSSFISPFELHGAAILSRSELWEGAILLGGRVFPVPAWAARSFPLQGRGGSGCAGRLSELSSSILVAAATPALSVAMTEQMTLRGTLKGHNGWVTQIATTPQFPDMILSASRGTG